MAKITPYTFTDGEAGISDELFDLFSGQDGDYFTVINGDLNGDNFVALPDIDYKNIQHNAFSGGGQVAGTAHLDFFSGGSGTPKGSGFFRGASLTSEDRYLPVPGASIQFYLPYEAYVLITWTVTWTNDNNDDDKSSNMCFFIDGETVGGQDALNTAFARRVRRTMFGGSNADEGGSNWKSVSARTLQDRYKSRTWSGHYFTPGSDPLAPGWHTASIRVCANGSVKQTRVRARSMKYVYFKYGATK